MQLTFKQLRTKEIVNVADGKKLGKICDVVLCYPEYKWAGIIAPTGGSVFKREQVIIEPKHIVKIGEDVILVQLCPAKPPTGKERCDIPPSPHPRNFDDFE